MTAIFVSYLDDDIVSYLDDGIYLKVFENSSVLKDQTGMNKGCFWSIFLKKKMQQK